MKTSKKKAVITAETQAWVETVLAAAKWTERKTILVERLAIHGDESKFSPELQATLSALWGYAEERPSAAGWPADLLADVEAAWLAMSAKEQAEAMNGWARIDGDFKTRKECLDSVSDGVPTRTLHLRVESPKLFRQDVPVGSVIASQRIWLLPHSGKGTHVSITESTTRKEAVQALRKMASFVEREWDNLVGMSPWAGEFHGEPEAPLPAKEMSTAAA